MSAERATQVHAVGVSVEALASAWARRDGVAAGSVVVVESEIAARSRLGEPWRFASNDSMAMAMVLRPDISINEQGLLWLVGSLAAANAALKVSDLGLEIAWPDSIQASADTDVGRVNVVTQLGPGKIVHAIIAIRFSLGGLGITSGAIEDLLSATVVELDAAAELLRSDPQRLIDTTVERTSTIGGRVKAKLLPRGEARGMAAAIDPNGRLVLETSTGMLEHLEVESLRSIERV